MKIYFLKYNNNVIEMMTEDEYQKFIADISLIYNVPEPEFIFPVEFDFLRLSSDLILTEISSKKFQIHSPV